MSYHTRHLVPGDVFQAPRDLEAYATLNTSNEIYYNWEVISNYLTIDLWHLQARCLTDPSQPDMDCLVSGHISLCMIEPEGELDASNFENGSDMHNLIKTLEIETSKGEALKVEDLHIKMQIVKL